MRFSQLIVFGLALAGNLTAETTHASAHPHVWVTVKATVLYENGAITGLQQAWTFDEMYTEMAIQGLDKNGDGKYDRQELAELAQVNIDGLKEFNYFTVAKLGDGDLKFKPPIDYWLDYKGKDNLTLRFTLPLEQPVLADAPGFKFSIYDPSFFIAFDLAKDDPVKLGAHAPAGCKTAIVEPKDDDPSAQQLNQAFSGVLSNGASVGFGMTKTVSVQCAKSG